uniref:Uncharacterized protein n=1 Tax=Anguilla anguilla TaxID=7936 RepID=A0A0E9PZR7_ANGAN
MHKPAYCHALVYIIQVVIIIIIVIIIITIIIIIIIMVTIIFSITVYWVSLSSQSVNGDLFQFQLIPAQIWQAQSRKASYLYLRCQGNAVFGKPLRIPNPICSGGAPG